jgi:hypothetical protein
LSSDLTAQFGRGFSVDNLEYMRRFFLAYPRSIISETLSRKSGTELLSGKSQTASRKFNLSELAQVFTLAWSAYVRLLSVKDAHARQFYEAEAWYRVDLLFFHRRLHCLVIIDLKLGSLTHADVGQMHLYCNYAKEHWTFPDENPPVGLILCADKGHALARYALEGLPTKVMAANYRTVLPDAELLQKELESTRCMLESRRAIRPKTRQQ